MAEAMERWDINMMQQEVHGCCRLFKKSIDALFCLWKVNMIKTSLTARVLIANNQVHMAHLAIIGSHSINGVAKLHTELLKKEVLHDFYRLYPERFNNKTNGVTLRRWMQSTIRGWLPFWIRKSVLTGARIRLSWKTVEVPEQQQGLGSADCRQAG